jgi:hypothetical protein
MLIVKEYSLLIVKKYSFSCDGHGLLYVCTFVAYNSFLISTIWKSVWAGLTYPSTAPEFKTGLIGLVLLNHYFPV